jgi:predicted phage terminase large subunit-like protein
MVLPGYPIYGKRSTGSKAERARAVAAAAEAGNVLLLRGDWIEHFLLECDGRTGHDDQLDALSGAFNALYEPEPKQAGTWGR